MNRLIKAYGPPDQIALELARELKLSEEEKKRRSAENGRNQEKARQRSLKLQELGVRDTGANRAILRLWEELNPDNALDRRCIYTGRQIGADMLFSGAVEVDHILPFSETLDDSQGNRLLCTMEANRQKRKRSPYGAFGTDPGRWDEIKDRAARLPKEKRWRFQPDAMERFDAVGGFLARQLIDTQHLSRLAREYLSELYPDRGEGSSHVWVSPGRLTEMLRRRWALNELLPDHNYAGGADQPKNRLDHRHHAVDALVVAVTDRSFLNRAAREAGLHGHEGAGRVAALLPDPWPGFRDDVRAAVGRIVASHRPDHGTASRAGLSKGRDATAGRLHNDTAYGFTGRQENGVDLVVRRVPLEGLKPDDLSDTGRRVADETLRRALKTRVGDAEGKAFLQALIRFRESHPTFAGIRRVRVVEPLSVIPIRDRSGRAYKAYKGDSNFRYDVWELRNGKWVSEVVSMFDAHQPGWQSVVRRENHNARKVLSLQIDDVVARGDGAERELLRVVKFSNGQIVLAAPNESGDLKRRHDLPQGTDPFRYVFASASRLKSDGARQVRIDELGRVLDPGPRTAPAAVAV